MHERCEILVLLAELRRFFEGSKTDLAFVLDFFVTFFVKEKSKEKENLNIKTLYLLKHSVFICVNPRYQRSINLFFLDTLLVLLLNK